MQAQHIWQLIYGMPERGHLCHKCCNANASQEQPFMTALLLASVVAAGAANVALVAFVADRLTPKSVASVSTAGELAVVNDNIPAPATVKVAA